MRQRIQFHWRYLTGRTPWDTKTTPPEVIELVEGEGFSRGRALDLGCGAGTNAIYLAQHGFDVVGIDFVGSAIRQARRRARSANVKVDFRCANVVTPGPLGKPFDLILDIGCFHSLHPRAQVRYAENTLKWTKPGSVLLMYEFFPKCLGGQMLGISPTDMERRFTPDFELLRYADDGKSAWYRFIHK